MHPRVRPLRRRMRRRRQWHGLLDTEHCPGRREQPDPNLLAIARQHRRAPIRSNVDGRSSVHEPPHVRAPASGIGWTRCDLVLHQQRRSVAQTHPSPNWSTSVRVREISHRQRVGRRALEPGDGRHRPRVLVLAHVGIDHERVVTLGAVPVVLPAAATRPWLEVAGQVVVVLAEIERPALPFGVEHEVAQVELIVVVAVVATFEADPGCVARPAAPKRRHVYPLEETIKRQLLR